MKNNFVFREESEGLVFVGDFDGLYKSETDPWGQSASSGTAMDIFYKRSRKAISDIVRMMISERHARILEVGCGLGYSTHELSMELRSATITGMDISSQAVSQARKLHPQFNFFQGDIRGFSNLTQGNYDVVLLHQMLWYVLEDLPQVLHQCQSLLRRQRGSLLLISQAFPREQKYGKHVMDGYEGACKYFRGLNNACLEHTVCSDLPDLPHIDCHFVLRFF